MHSVQPELEEPVGHSKQTESGLTQREEESDAQQRETYVAIQYCNHCDDIKWGEKTEPADDDAAFFTCDSCEKTTKPSCQDKDSYEDAVQDES